MSRGGARAALAATVVAGLVLLGAAASGSGFSVGSGTVAVLAGGTVGFVVRRRSPRIDGRPAAGIEGPRPTREGTVRPPQRAGAFQERQVLKDLMALFGTSRRGGRAVLQGLAGVGKTQIAAEYARRMRDSGIRCVWVDASSRDSILRGLSLAAASVLGADGRDVRWAADRMLDWLDRVDEPWLVVLDDLRDPHDMIDLWPPDTPCGQVVVTTELRDAVDTPYVSEVRPFRRKPSIAFLTERLARYPHQWEGAAELAEALGDHPLALELAAAHILVNRDLTCATYLALFDDRCAGGLPVATTWSLSIERAGGLARPLLTLVSVLCAHGVPAAVLTAPATLRHLRSTVGHAVSAQDVRDTLSRLHGLSLITYDPGVVRVHALVQRVVRATMTRREVARAVRAMAVTMVSLWPSLENDGELGAALRVNAMAMRDVADLQVWDPWVRALWSRVGFSLGESGQAEAARRHFQDVVAACDRRFGPRAHFTLQARLCLAHWQGEADDAVGAVSALKQLIREAPRRFPFQRRLILKARLALARWLSVAGDQVCALAEADALIDELHRRGDPETLYARNIRVRCLALLGRTRGAVDEMVAVVAEFERQKGADHLDTLSARNNLAGTRHQAGDHATAIVEFTELLPDLCRVLDPCHPKTLRTRNYLTRCRIDADDPAVSVAEAQQLVADCTQVLGLSHPETLVAWNNLSRLFAKAVG